ncbi:MAG: carboxypeptidase regulatory-like domain-containing protein [Chloroflexota bacterium]
MKKAFYALAMLMIATLVACGGGVDTDAIVEQVGDAAENVAEGVGEVAQDAAEAVGEAVGDATDAIEEEIAEVMNDDSAFDARGTWVGIVEQPDWDAFPTYQAVMQIEDLSEGSEGLIEYPNLACGGPIVLIEANDTEYVFEAYIEYDENGICGKAGLIAVSALDENQLAWTWSYEDGTEAAFGTLQRDGEGSVAEPVTEPAPLDAWAGNVVTDRGIATTDVVISINGVEVAAGPEGFFELSVPRAADDRYVINAEKDGFVPVSEIHVGSALTDLNLVLKQVEMMTFDPAVGVAAEDSSGTQINIAPDQLETESGEPIQGDVTMEMYTYDLDNEQMVGDMSGTNMDGEAVSMESAGAFYASFEDEAGNDLNLAEGTTAEISIPAVVPEREVPLTVWSYNEETGLWEEEAVATLEDGRYVAEVSHFSSWNFDWEMNAPACIKLDVDQSFLTANPNIQVKAVFKTTPEQTRTLYISKQETVLINIPPNINVDFFMPPNSPEPYTSATSGAAWGGTGTPADYSSCQGIAEIKPIPGGSIQGVKYQDTNNNGARDTGEPGLPGWTIQVADSVGSIQTVVTDDNGAYTINLDKDDTYTVSEVQQEGWTQTFPTGGGTHSVDVNSGKHVKDIDFGNHFENSCSVPLDIVFVVDVTASMQDAINGVKGELDEILNDISGVSGGDYQLGLVTFNDDVFVLNNLAPNNLTSVKANISSLNADGGVGIPEASDEALNTVINNLAVRADQTGDFTGTWRPNARKHVIVVTNAVPGGFDDAYSDADKTNAETHAQTAKNKDIKIDALFVPASSDDVNGADAEQIMQSYASITGGTYFKTNASGSNAAAEILNIVTSCAGPLEGQVTDAVTGNAISGAQVCLNPATTNVCATTDADCNYRFESVSDGDYAVSVTGANYITIDDGVKIAPTAGETSTKSFALSPVLAAGELRIVLEWRNDPDGTADTSDDEDLDSYLWYPDVANPIYHDNMNLVEPANSNPRLDKDALQGPGPETVTIPEQVAGTYQYAVKFHAKSDRDFISTNAVVRVYQGDREIKVYQAPAGTGEWWHVFSIDGSTGAITDGDSDLKSSPPLAIP